jgi:diguanylate cyclase (GGDEF)-like protein/PAS domain S-box-containing protein
MKQVILMLKEFVLNVCLLITVLFIAGHFSHKRSFLPHSPLRNRLLGGIFLGLLGVLMMYFSIRITSSVMSDMRHIPILLAALYGGFSASFIAAAIVAVSRLLILGTFDASTLMTALIMLLLGIMCGYISRFPAKPFIRLTAMNLICILTVAATLYLRLPDKDLALKVIRYHAGFSLIGGLLAYFVTQFLSRANETMRKLKENMQQLHESERRYRRLIESSPDATFVLYEGTILFINEKTLRLLRADRYDQVVGQRMELFLHPDEVAASYDRINAMAASGVAVDKEEQRYFRCDGSMFHAEISISPVHYEGKPSYMGVVRDVSERKKTDIQLREALAELEMLSNADSLTQISNRRHFDEMLAAEWKKAAHDSRSLSLILLDIDYFKAFNDRYGHQTGDACLKEVAQTIRSSIRQPSDFAARYGGEEFVIILPDTELEEASAAAETIRMEIEKRKIAHASSKISLYVTVSLGIACLQPHLITDANEIVAMADKALYRAKEQGRNQVSIYNKAG